ncbi:uncharacterized protein LOC131693064 isoform X9 [Topomyia yanbarensis]|uniref:uncharacterized protein LOC131693064 isoform X9 n=1 Tax=Topomyia yanbarensis TaxID=2498891 RepID=UPI00273B613F|nr:uncharacterized protein LOC131693064 isoform X9 [Topomyia yanbarensis]
MATTVNNRVESSGGTLGTRKTLIIMVTVVGCIAILWPKVFYPMMTGPGQTKTVIKDHRGPGCCDVVLDQETFANASINVPSQHSLFRKRVIGPVEEHISIRQERPPHLRPETVHPAMRERGRAIPQAGSIHSERPSSQPRIVEGRPGPIPGMRPPMGAGSHQPTKSANSMGFIMPLYTIGIVSFFIYTILKLVFKKTPTAPYPEIKPDPTFRNEVFATEQYIKRPESGNTKLVNYSPSDSSGNNSNRSTSALNVSPYAAGTADVATVSTNSGDQLMELDLLRRKLDETEQAMTKIIAKISAIPKGQETEETENSETAERLPESNGHVVKTPDSSDSEATEETLKSLPNAAEDALKVEKQYETGAVPKKRETSVDRGTMKVIPMEKKAKYETGRQQSNRPATPVQSVILDASHPEADTADSKCILLDSKSPPASKVVVADSDLSIETLDATHKHCEEAPFDLNLIVVFESVSNLNQGRSLELNVLLGSEPTANVQPSAATRVASPTREVVLSGKMKLSLVKLDDNSKKSNDVVAAEVQDDGAENKKGDSHEWTAPTEE